jgi:hypothetical protein
MLSEAPGGVGKERRQKEIAAEMPKALSASEVATPPGIEELVRRLENRAYEFERLGVLVDGAALCRFLRQELEQALAGSTNRILSLAQAAALSGYSEAHLARLVKQGKLRSLRHIGSRGHMTFRAGDLPHKPLRTHHSDAGVHELASRLGVRGKGGRHGQS